MEFTDLTPQPEIQLSSVDAPTSDIGEYHDVELNNFMSRPIRIANITWTYGAAINGVLNPWTLFFTDTRVKNRLAFYNLLKCKLCVKFVVNGNAFQYGQMFVDYLPLTSYTVNGVVLNDDVSPVDTTSLIYPNVQTHRDYIKIRPLDSLGACMSLPFYWPNNFMSIPLEEWKYMGDLRYFTVNPVLHANNASATDPPIISVFAWAEDVKISVPTSAPPATLLPQAGTEVVGAISGPATALSRIAGSLANVPVIGSYARATAMAASGIGSVAKMFGFSRPPIESAIAPMKPDYVGNLANTDRPENVAKLTIDSSQEVTIDPSVTGINRGDELSIKSIASRETYLTQFTWDYTQGPDSYLFHIRVNPLLHALVPGYTVTRAIYPTGVEFASIPFKYWRGSLKFRFEVIGSKFHKGRIRTIFDPVQIPNVANFNVNYQNVLDLDSSTESEVTVRWTVPQPVLKCGTLSLSSVKYGGPATPPVYGEDNGALYLYVLNNLSVPSQSLAAADCQVYVNVYVSACDDFELFVPDDVNLSSLTTAVPFEPSSDVEMVPSSGEETVSSWEVGELNSDPNFNLVMFGEQYTTFRSLLKRYASYCNYLFLSTASTNLAKIVLSVRRVPLPPGNDASGINTVTNLLGAAVTQPGNLVRTSLLHHLMYAFSGMRGSFRYKYQFITNASSTPSNALLTTLRLGSTVSTAPIVSLVGASTAITNDSWALSTLRDRLWNGAVMTNTGRQPLLEIEDPYYENYRFIHPKTYMRNDVSVSGGHSITCYTSSFGAFGNYVRSMVATGEDFNLMYYTGPGYLWTSAYY